METPLQPPLSPRRRVNSATSLPDNHVIHHTGNPLPSSATLHPSPIHTVHSNNIAHTSPISPHSAPDNQPSNTPPPPPTRDITPADLLAAMRDQQTFITRQQTLFQEERDYARFALQEQHDFMAEQQRQLMSLLVNRPPQPDNLSRSGVSVNSLTGPKVRMADPPTFDGSIKETENFLSSLENIFDSQPGSFPSVESKIRYSLTFLSGGASNWRKLLLRDINEGNFLFTTWGAFEKRFRDTFGNPHQIDEARRKLWTIRQGTKTSEEFFLEFEDLRLEADICENSLVMFLQSALRPSVLNEVLRRDPPPVTYTEWKAASLRADHNQRNSAATRTFHQQTFPTQRSNSFVPFRPRPTFSTNVTAATSSNPSTDKIIPKPNISPFSSKHADSKNKNCWKCGKEGHFSRNCPDQSSNSKIRALFDHCDELDAAYEATSTGADFLRKMLESEGDDIDDEECRSALERFVFDHPVFVEHDE